MRIIEGFTLRDVLGQPTVIGEGVQQIDFNKLITLNHSAAYLWRAVVGREFTREELAGLLVDYYGIDATVALSDATDIVDEWMQIGLIVG